MKKLSIFLFASALVVMTVVTLFSTSASRRPIVQKHEGIEPFTVLPEAPKNYPFNAGTGFTITQVITKVEMDGGRSLFSTITRYIRPDHSDLQLVEYADGKIDLQWHTPEGRYFSWETGDANVTDHGVVKTYVPGPAEFDEFKAKAKLFVIYHNLVCSIATRQQGSEVYSPEIPGLPLWEERANARLETVALKRGAPDETRLMAALARIPPSVTGNRK